MMASHSSLPALVSGFMGTLGRHNSWWITAPFTVLQMVPGLGPKESYAPFPWQGFRAHAASAFLAGKSSHETCAVLKLKFKTLGGGMQKQTMPMAPMILYEISLAMQVWCSPS